MSSANTAWYISGMTSPGELYVVNDGPVITHYESSYGPWLEFGDVFFLTGVSRRPDPNGVSHYYEAMCSRGLVWIAGRTLGSVFVSKI